MSTAAVIPDDPYAQIAKPIADDPYAAIAKPIAAPAGPTAENKAAEGFAITPAKFGTGMVKGLGNTIAGISEGIHALPMVGPKIIPDEGLQRFHELTQPKNLGEQVGHAAEQGAEFLLPGGAEEKAGLKAAELFPRAAKYVKPIAKIATSGLTTGALNKAQGGEFGTGAIAGAAGSALSPLLRKAAAGLADVAAAPGKRLLKSIPEDVNIGRTILDNTPSTTFTPKRITRELESKIAGQNDILEGAIDKSERAGRRGSIVPARQTVAAEMNNAVEQNAPEYIKDVGKLRDQLRYKYGENGEPVTRLISPPTKPGAGFAPVPIKVPPIRVPEQLPADMPAGGLRKMKQGVSTVIGNWNPENQGAGKALEKRVYGSINEPFHQIVGPEGAAADKSMSSLIPAKDAMWNTSYNPSVTRSVFNRIARPTGALAGGLMGSYEGYKRGGLGGGIIGGGAGLLLPELISSPTGQMISARALNSRPLRRFGTGMALQIARPSEEDDERTNKQ